MKAAPPKARNSINIVNPEAKVGSTLNQRRILLVDDEQAILDGLERRLEDDFEVVTCCSGQEALELLERDPNFPAILSDMRMPEMNGIEFIEAARKIVPQAVFMMLTGNQDVETAQQAVNRACVYRFLTKPCRGVELIDAIEAAIHQVQKAEAKREIISTASAGSVKLLFELVRSGDVRNAALAGRISCVWEHLCTQLKWNENYDAFLTGRLCLVGASTLGEKPLASLADPSVPVDASSAATFKDTLAASAKILQGIPKLRRNAEIVSASITSDSSLDGVNLAECSLPYTPENAGVLLGLVAAFCVIRRKSEKVAEAQLEEFYPKINMSAVRLIQQSVSETSPKLADATAYDLSELADGMVLAEPLTNADGRTIFAAADRVSSRMRAYLRDLHGVPKQIRVTL